MIADSRKNGEVTTFFTDREGGVSQGCFASFNLGYFSGDERSCVDENRSLLCGVLGIPPESLIVPNEVHGNRVMVIDQDTLLVPMAERDEFFKCDALVTTCRNVCLGVTVADCVPVLFYDEEHHVIAAAHAGWKGIVSDVLGETVKRMCEVSFVVPSGLTAEIWPSISAPRFEVGEEVVDRFQSLFPEKEMSGILVREGYPKPHINLRGAVRARLLALGLRDARIWTHPDCTFSDPRYFSARRDGFACGRMVAGILVN
ncbi:MAG: peptidoglycan editing factor PgeF [Paludibacteraceae bacterium]|nr:peptidoglycan editing factor PgeF [Paludibacteraceae bacterium]